MFVFQAKSVSILLHIGSYTDINSLTEPKNLFLVNNIYLSTVTRYFY